MSHSLNVGSCIGLKNSYMYRRKVPHPIWTLWELMLKKGPKPSTMTPHHKLEYACWVSHHRWSTKGFLVECFVSCCERVYTVWLKWLCHTAATVCFGPWKCRTIFLKWCFSQNRNSAVYMLVFQPCYLCCKTRSMAGGKISEMTMCATEMWLS